LFFSCRGLALAVPVAACYTATAAGAKTIRQMLLASTLHRCHHECAIRCDSQLIVAFQFFSAGLTDVAIAVIACCMATAATAGTLLLSTLRRSVHEGPVVAVTVMIVLPSDTRTYGIRYRCHCSVRLAACCCVVFILHHRILCTYFSKHDAKTLAVDFADLCDTSTRAYG